MSELTRSAVRKAKSVFANAGPKEIPVPIEKIVKQHGIVLRRLALDDEMSGMAFIKDLVAVIVVNISHHPNRQRFTIAHELAHHLLHKSYLESNIHVDKSVLRRDYKASLGTDAKEIEANAFAAELLMPTSKIITHKNIDINNETIIAKLARDFGVSAASMTYRLMNLSQES